MESKLLISFLLLCFISFSLSITKLGGEAGSRPAAFANIAMRTRAFVDPGTGKAAPLDGNGWPLSDLQTVLFDDRPYAEWAGHVDDPSRRQPDMGGTYTISFSGKGDITAEGMHSSIPVTNVKFDTQTWSTTADLVFPHHTDDVCTITIKNTQRNSTAHTNSGITAFVVYQPGYDSSSTWTKEFLELIKPVSRLRFMGWKGTNYQTGYYGDQGHHLFTWNQRTLPTDVPQGNRNLRPGAIGIAWEHIVNLANLAQKDVWINMPMTATGACNELLPGEKTSYMDELANLFKNGNSYTNNKGLDSNLKIYIEHSNEVWNFGFSQYTWNKLAAIDEVTKNPNSPLANGCSDEKKCEEEWAQRRHIKCVHDIATTFEKYFGTGSIGTRILPIYADWTHAGVKRFNETLSWYKEVYGDPSKMIYGMAITHYFGFKPTSGNETVSQVVDGYRAASNAGASYTQSLGDLAKSYGLKLTAYEAGPGWSVGSTTDIGNVIMAHRDPAMQQIIVDDIVKNWWQIGGSEYNYFSLAGGYSRFGMWGATDETVDLSTPKYKGVVEAATKG